MRRTIFAVVALVMVGCATSGPKLAKVSNDTAHSFVSDFERVEPEQIAAMRMYGARYHAPLPGEIVEWVQPSNKFEPCKIFFAGNTESGRWWQKPGTEVYWDGDCANGYAFDTGREFVFSEHGLQSSLANYAGGNRRPSYYLNVGHDEKSIEYVAANDSSFALQRYDLIQTPEQRFVRVSSSTYDGDDLRAYNRVWNYGADAIYEEVVLPNHNRYTKQQFANPMNSGIIWEPKNSDQVGVGYGVGVRRDAVENWVRHVKKNGVRGDEMVDLPQDYLMHLTQVDNSFKKYQASLNQMLSRSYLEINKYKRRICNGEVRFPPVEDQTYGRICLENGDLSEFESVMEASVKLREQNHERAHEQIARLRKERTDAQAVAAAQRERQSQQFAKAMDDFSDSMSALYQGSTQALQAAQSFQAPTVQFGLPQQTTTRCVSISNVINCRSY